MANEINTFSAAVDDVVSRSGRADRRADILTYVRASMQEAQVMAFFDEDRVEDTLTTTAAPYIWTRPDYFRLMEAVSYPALIDPRGRPIYPAYVRPGKNMRNKEHYFYAGPSYFVFAGFGDVGSDINISYFSYFPRMFYFEDLDTRPARYLINDDGTLGWVYATAESEEDQEAARAVVSNWLLFRWYDLVVEGALAKLFKTVADERAVSSFALFSAYKKQLLQGEAMASISALT